MRPLLKEGKLVRVAPCAPSAFKLGDCVVYDWEGKTLLHRIWWRNARGFWLKDDVGLMKAHFVTREQVLGKAKLAFWREGLFGLASSLATNCLFSAKRLFDHPSLKNPPTRDTYNK